MRWALMLCLATGLVHAGDKPRLVAQLGHPGLVGAVAFSPDGRFVLTGGTNSSVRLWDTATGKELRHFEGHAGLVQAVAFSRDGRFVITGASDRTARVWDAATAREIRVLRHDGIVSAVSFSRDGRLLLTGSSKNVAYLWDAATGERVRSFEGHSGWIQAAVFSADDRQVLTASFDKTARLWDAATGEVLRRFEGHTGRITTAALSADGRFVLTGSDRDVTARLWDAATGKELRCFEGHTGGVGAVAFSPDGRTLLTGGDDGSWRIKAGEDGTVRLWETATGKLVRRFDGHDTFVSALCFSTDGRFVLTGSWDRTARLWDAATGRHVRTFEGHSVGANSAVLSADGSFVLTGGSDESARLWDTTAGKQVRFFDGHRSRVHAASLSADGRFVLTGAYGGARLWDRATGKQLRRFKARASWSSLSPDARFVLTTGLNGAQLWDAATGKKLRRFEGGPSHVWPITFSPDSRLALATGRKWVRVLDAATGRELRRLGPHTGFVGGISTPADGRVVLTGAEWDKTARLWDVATGSEIRSFGGHTQGVRAVAISADGRFVVTTGSFDETVRLWDAAAGTELRRFKGHTGTVHAVSFSHDGRFLLTAAGDNTVRFWTVATGTELCRLIGFRDGTWAVVDAKGRFDASDGGDIEGLHWVVGNEVISLDQLKDRYYEPGLLAKVLGRSKEPLREVKAFVAPKLFPAVGVEKKGNVLLVRLRNRGGGIGRVVVRINGKEVAADARARGADPDAAEMTVRLDLADDPRLKPGADNAVVVEAYNAEGYLRSRGITIGHRVPGKPVRPQLWAILAGVSDYRGDRIDLGFASKDAEDFATGLRAASERLFGKEHVHLTVLADAKRADLVDALKAARKARPADILVLYLAGHGVNHGEDFYYLTADASSASLKDPGVRAQVALSSRELTELIKEIAALKQVMILDTCASGRLIEKLTERRNVPGSQIRALERMKDRTGLHVLSGCAADSVSYETSRYGQGLLTYSLLLGMKGAALRGDEYVDVSRLFQFTRDRVEQLARDIGGVQQPVISAPKNAASFDLGRLTDEDKARVPLRTPRPLFLRSSFQDERRFRDVLQLSKRVNARLADVASRGTLVYVDASDFPQAFTIVGRYRIKGDAVNASVVLFRGEEERARFEVAGKATDLDALAQRIVDEAQRRLK